MSDMVKKLRERRGQVFEQMKAIADRGVEENRNLTAEEQGQWDVMNEELDQLDERIKSALDTEQRARDADDAFNRLHGGKKSTGQGPGDGGQRGGQGAGDGGNQDELRAWMRGETRSRYYDVRPEGRIDWRGIQQRALTIGAATGGGDTVPTTFYDRLVQHLIQNSAIMQSGAMVLNTDSGETIQVPKTTAHSSASIVAEGGTIGESDPTFGQVELGAYKYGTLIQISRELLDDTGVDLEGYLAMQAGRALGNAFGAHAIVGDGTAKPRGVVTDATVGITGGTGVGGAFTSDDVIDLFHSVIAPYRRSQAAVWMMADTSIASMRKLKDTTGQYIWQPGLQAGAPDTILGKPVLMDPNVAAIATSAKSIIFGDMSQYFVRLAGGVRFERSDEYAFDTDLVTFRALMRADGALVDLTGAVKVFQGAAS
ncbi:phage major capsid protein [Streptomyces beihaiensis]|uniref:Phage major capsid protein n=1 Tax=Streptomyces beihaiensis TaxID=2984495 RepID=A0ABT3U7P6_9ACTN|nr:phage major capsid protein [Streptomyces beihaiensis]MCX3064210.1 phage major capsid protein [Streptomyces beihaiensis]